MRLTLLIQSNNFRTLFILLSSSIVYFGTLHVSRIIDVNGADLLDGSHVRLREREGERPNFIVYVPTAK